MEREDKQKLYCEYEIIDEELSNNNSKGKISQEGSLLLSIRGHSSRYFEKKQYAVKIVDEGAKSKKESLLGMPAETTWCLNGSYIDHSMIRNYMLYNISGEIMSYAPRCRMCEVFLTDENGEDVYQGVYTLIEKPKISKERLNLPKYNQNAEKTAYWLQMNRNDNLVQVEHLGGEEIFRYPFKIEYPKEDEITKSTYNYIKDDIFTLEKQFSDALHTNEWENVNKSLDMKSFVDYYLINEFFQNYDAGGRSTFLYKNVDDKYYMGPVWDFDGAFNKIFDEMFENNTTISSLELQNKFYYYYLKKNPVFVDLCIRRYRELRKSFLSEEYLLNYIDGSVKYLEDAAVRNCDLWYEGNMHLFYEDIDRIKKFIKERGDWLDQYFEESTRINN